LASRNGVYDKIRAIFEFVPGNQSPPIAPKHTTNKPKAPKKPAVPKFNSSEFAVPPEIGKALANRQEPAPAPRVSPDPYENISAQLNDDETPDDTTVASASFMGEDDRYDMSAPSTAHRKRKREEPALSTDDQNHMLYSDELLDYFMLAQADEPSNRPEPPPNFRPDWLIDTDHHTAMHWAAAMGDLDVMKQLKRFGANLQSRNVRGETPLIRSVIFTNCQDKQTFPRVVQELIGTIERTDNFGSTAIHHAAAMTTSKNKHHCARYYLDVILNKLSETLEQEQVIRILDMQDMNGNTALHIAARNRARKCIRALIGRGASTDIQNGEGVRADEIIQELNNMRRERNLAASSSPFAPDSHRRISFHEPTMPDSNNPRRTTAHHSEAAMTVESKVTPLILEKFQDLAKSFDEELVDRDNSEKEAKRILQSTHIELAQVQEKIMALAAVEEDDASILNEETELAHAQQQVMNLIEQQQHHRLATAIMREESMTNGHDENHSTDLKIEILRRLDEEKEKRVKLVQDYQNALSMAGMGQKGEMYRKLTAKCLGLREDEVDGQLEGLLSVLEEDSADASVAQAMLME
jgi:transcription factor MBP1